jgi:hypothetical protein
MENEMENVAPGGFGSGFGYGLLVLPVVTAFGGLSGGVGALVALVLVTAAAIALRPVTLPRVAGVVTGMLAMAAVGMACLFIALANMDF